MKSFAQRYLLQLVIPVAVALVSAGLLEHTRMVMLGYVAGAVATFLSLTHAIAHRELNTPQNPSDKDQRAIIKRPYIARSKISTHNGQSKNPTPNQLQENKVTGEVKET